MRSRPLRVLVVIPSFEGGGAERAWATLLRILHGDGLAFEVARFRPGGIFESELPATLATHVVPGRRGDPRAVLGLARLIRRRRPDVVIGVLRWAAVATLAATRLARTGASVVVSEQNPYEMDFAQGRAAWLKRHVLRSLYPRADCVAVLSRGIAGAFVAGLGVDPARVRVIPNPVDLDVAAARAAEPCPHPWPGHGGPPVVAAAGRLVAQKGFDTLLHAFRKLRDARPARLVVLGEGPLRAELFALRDRLGLGDDVDFPGFVTNPYAVFARSACFALSSRFEGFGNVLVEAMACGTPVVATRCPSGPPEIVTDGVDGLLVPVDDAAALAAAVGRVLAEPAVAGALSRAGRVRAADFAAERVARAYRALFSEVRGVPVCGRAGAPA